MIKYIVLILSIILSTNCYAQYYGSSNQVYRAATGNTTLERLPGPRHAYPHMGCMMCLGNHLLGSHGVSYNYLNQIGWTNWETLHDNLHNQNNVVKVKRTTKKVDPKKEPIYAPTPQNMVEAMLRIAQVKSTDLLVDMGCGDGRIPITAAKIYGCRAAGFEIQKRLADIAKANVELNNLTNKVSIFNHDMFKTTLKHVDVVTLYLEPELNTRLIPLLREMKPGSRVVSYEHEIIGMKYSKIFNVPEKVVYNTMPQMYDMSPSENKVHKIYLYIIGEDI